MTTATPRGRRACVLGAGIVGCATAHALAQAGWEVTLVDALAAPGLGATYANGAQLSYSYVEPLATPGALRALPGWLLSSTSPLRWKPRPSRAHLLWLLYFVAACRSAQVQRTTAALLALASLSRATLHTWFEAAPALAAQALHARPGKLVLYRDPGAREGVQRQLQAQRALGCEQELLDAAQCLAHEPALAHDQSRAPVAFGVWTTSEEVADAALLALGLAEQARAGGARWRMGERAVAFETTGGAVTALRLQSGERLSADAFVLTAGASAAALAAPLGVRLPVEPIKGYSVTLPIVDAARAPLASVTDTARNIVHARLGAQLRVAGFAELVGSDTAVDAARIAALCETVDTTFPGACDMARPQPWAGLRPATPPGRPLVGATRWRGLWINAGHGALGLTLAAGSAQLLRARLQGDPPPIDGAPFLWRSAVV